MSERWYRIRCEPEDLPVAVEIAKMAIIEDLPTGPSFHAGVFEVTVKGSTTEYVAACYRTKTGATFKVAAGGRES